MTQRSWLQVRRWKYRRRTPFQIQRKPLSFSKVLLYSFIIFMFFNFISLWLVDQSITPIIRNVAKTEMTRIATEAINESIFENITQQVDIHKLIVRHEGDPPTFSFDPKEYTRILSVTTKDIEKRLGISTEKHDSERNINQIQSNQIESIVYYIPLGVATRNTLLANLGPKIPVELALVKDVESKLRTKMSDGGINSTYIELFVDFEVDIQIVIPFFTDEPPVKFEAKIGDFFYPGKVPNYYSEGQSLPPPAIIDDSKKSEKE